MTETMIVNEEVVQRLYSQAMNRRDFNVLNDLIAEEFVGINGLRGAAGFENQVRALIMAFPDIQWHVQDVVSDENKVVVRWIWKGTHQGQFQQFEATGKSFSNEGMGIYELKEGKIISAKILTDRLDFLQQMEAVPRDVRSLLPKSSALGYFAFIDKFFVPTNSVGEFTERMNYNRNFIKTQPGLVKSERYDHTDDSGNLTVITIAVWQNQESLDKAKAAVQAEFRRIGFDPQAFYKRLNIRLERGVYNSIPE